MIGEKRFCKPEWFGNGFGAYVWKEKLQFWKATVWENKSHFFFDFCGFDHPLPTNPRDKGPIYFVGFFSFQPACDLQLKKTYFLPFLSRPPGRSPMS